MKIFSSDRGMAVRFIMGVGFVMYWYLTFNKTYKE